MKIVQVVGFGRSGSTLLNRLLMQRYSVNDLGEVRFFYERGLRNNELCSCGKAFLVCPFWSGVLESLSDKVPRDELLGFIDINFRAQRNRSLLATFFDKARFEKFARQEIELMRAISVKSSSAIVDSSKIPVRSHIYSRFPELKGRAYIIHLVRDPRAVSYSWTKKVLRPETGDDEEMARFSVYKSTLLWVGVNLISWLLKYRYGERYLRVSYEELCRSPLAMLERVACHLGVTGADEKGLESMDNHSISGNPMRFKPLGAISPDESWKKNLTKRERFFSSVLAYPFYLLLR